MKEKGFAPILLIIGIFFVTLTAGGTYYLNSSDNKLKKESSVKDKAFTETFSETNTSSEPVLENEKTPAVTPSNTPSTSHSLSAIEVLRNRASVTAPTSTPTPNQSLAPTHTPTPTLVPTPTPTPICTINIDNSNKTITSDSNGAILSLSPSNGASGKGESFVIQIKFDPNGRTIDSVDAGILFDPSKLMVTSVVGNTSAYSQVGFPAATFSNSTGKIWLSLIDESYKGFTTSATIGEITFQVVNSASGSMDVNFIFDIHNNQSDSNVVERNNINDVLGQVNNGVYSVKPAGCN